jgi:uncharacterized protein (TIGR02284 family)
MARENEPAHDAIVLNHPAAAELILGARGSVYPGAEVQYWREAYSREPYFDPDRNFEDYHPAYELGSTGYSNYGGEFDTADRVLANDWDVHRGVSRLSWDEARPACRAAWQRAHNASTYHTDGSAPAETVIATLSDAVNHARDGELGFTEAAAHTETPALKEFFERRARACRDSAAELQQQLSQLGGQAEESGSVSAAAHRVWLQIRGLFGGAGDDTILAECQRGESEALSHLREALQRNLPDEIHAVMLRQYECTQRNQDMVKTLLARERSRAESNSGAAA